MNKENLQQLIDAIKLDGATKFNMSAFIGKFNANYKFKNVFEHGELASTYKSVPVQNFTMGTDLFNCTSMGCIAGFATALANDWKTPEWLEDEDTAVLPRYFEESSNNFLGFSFTEGKNIYYNNGSCIWKWLIVNEPDRYKFKLVLHDDENYDETSFTEEILETEEWNSEGVYVDDTTIDYLSAVDVLTRILNEEIGLSNEYDEPFYINKEAVVS